ncbi:Rho GTPase activation protein [Epithele typhae]|uniref:Rho GTPase activation protein n=1 Tax=Epithele typhae TaxID=378194 RepID=UPI0020078EA9|nr:Rho GTPase activation protein [Epithele typhae]KAH9944375.1 Rho GTPase activation protein [Epithele typhae]
MDREFYVSVELYVSAKAAAALRKPPNKRSGDKRDAVRAASGGSDAPPKRVKEKASWLGLARNSTNSGQWRPARCKLVEEEEGCLLNIYVDDTILYRSIYMYLLNHTDIRVVHRSLFERRNCLAVFSVAGQMRGAAPTSEPLYIQFEDEETAHTWLALLRSYAMPEVYGRWLSPEDGGLYRMWRQVDLSCLQGRNLGVPRPLLADDAANGGPGGLGGGSSGGPSGDGDGRGSESSEAVDMDVYCEVFFNGTLCGRTTVKKGIGSPDWYERFLLPDLPPFENLEIVIWREKRLSRPVTVGSVNIVLVNFRRGEPVEGWYPVVNGGPTSSTQAGEMRLKVRVDEEIILPYAAYSKMLKTLHSRNHLDWMRDLESRMKTKNVNQNIMAVAIAKSALLDDIIEQADREVDGTLTSHNTLFRGNTVFTKTVELYMSWYGMPFLEASIGASIRRLCSEKVAIEVDPVRIGKTGRAVEKNVELLVVWCQEFWDRIYDARRLCPPEMRRLFEHTRRLVESQYRNKDDQSRELPWQSVSAFCFLRFIVPAILHPHLFGLLPGLPDISVQRSLTLIAKVIQSLANLNPSVQKEDYMRGVKEFLTNSLQAMIDYIIVVSTPEPTNKGPQTPLSSDKHERLRIMNALRQRGATAPVLHREAIPLLPHLLDIPRHLAVITSVVVRYSRTQNSQPPKDALSGPSVTDDRHFAEFSARCLEVEEQALFRVSKLAAKPRRQHSEPVINVPIRATPASPALASPSSPWRLPLRERKISSSRGNTNGNGNGAEVSSPAKRIRRKGSRPSTAPSSPERSEEGGRGRKSMGSGPNPASPRSPRTAHPPLPSLSPQTPTTADASFEGRSRTRRPVATANPHPRSTSTDSPLARKTVPPLLSPTMDPSLDGSDDAGKRRRNIFRAILTRR